MSVDRTPPQRLTFPPERRVRRKVEFEAAYKRGRRVSDGLFTMTVRANDVGGPRLGLAIAARTIGNAVARNRLRRLIRESFRLHRSALPALDIVVSGRAPAHEASPAILRAALERLWQRIAAS